MKKTWISVLCLLLALTFVLVGCKDDTTNPNNNNDDTNNPTVNEETGPYTHVSNYLPSNLLADMKDQLRISPTSFECLTTDNAPYVILDVFEISAATVKSITIPVYKTGKADVDGNFYFTIYACSNSYEGLRQPATETYKIKINGAQYNLEENKNVYTFITVDLTDYHISIYEDQTLAFMAKTDTIYPAVIPHNTSTLKNDDKVNPYEVLHNSWNVEYYYKLALGVGEIAIGHDFSILFDFQFERTYESKAIFDNMVAAEAAEEEEFQKMVKAVRTHYAAQSVSMMGDSISTFSKVTDNTAYSDALHLNRTYYWGTSGSVTCSEETWWGKFADQAAMDYCVMHGWSSSRAYGGGRDKNDDRPWTDSMLQRATELTNKSGDTPELILVYLGINDVSGSPWGELYDLLTAEGRTQTDEEIIAQWFEGVKTQAKTTGSNITPGETFTDWFASYALALDKMKTLYPNADIYCIGLIQSNHSTNHKEKVDDANVCLRALTSYFNVGFVDQERDGEITLANCHIYGHDLSGLHPNARGHDALFRLIVKTIYQDLKNK